MLFRSAVSIRPGNLTRGATPSSPWAVEGVLHVGDRTNRLPGYVDVLGRSTTATIAYVSGIHTDRIYAVPDAGSPLLLQKVDGGQGAALSDDGRLLFLRDNGHDSRIRVLSTEDGHLVASRLIRGFSVPLGGTDKVVYLAGGGKTLVWALGSGIAELIDAEADLVEPGPDLFTTVTGAGTDSCTSLRLLSDPSQVLWHSCTERIVSLAPGGGRMLTTPWRERAGGSRLAMRTTNGDLLARYRGQQTWFDRFGWEDDATALLRASAGRRSAYVRCTGPDCEQAGGVAVAPAISD